LQNTSQIESEQNTFMKNISVIGAGTMGNGIAHTFAQHGFQVNLIDLNPIQLGKALQIIEKNMDRQVAKSLMTPAEKKNSLEKIHLHQEIEAGVNQADLVIEAATENEGLKLEIFRTLQKKTMENCILASNTSSISITRLASATNTPGRVIGMHFMNPVPVMKLVEVIKGYATRPEVAGAIVDLTQRIGKIPVLVHDYPGFIANRILMPMINEAIYSLHEGVAGLSEIDQIMKLGMSHPMGPLQLADYIGLDICHSILNVLLEGFGNPKYAPCPLLTRMVDAGCLGVKTGEGFYLYSPGTKESRPSQRFA
jgi:3-hydroxybutyryl-CoA dehydrogenase